MTILGMTGHDIKTFRDLLIKANVQQLKFMKREVDKELDKRCNL